MTARENAAATPAAGSRAEAAPAVADDAAAALTAMAAAPAAGSRAEAAPAVADDAAAALTATAAAPAAGSRAEAAVADDAAAALTAADAVAEAAAARAGVRIRTLTELADFDAVHRLFDAIWHPDPANPPITAELMRALTKAGNYVAGAYDGDTLIGASAGFFGPPAHRELHSHISGVSAAALGRDAGFALKLHQRAWALRRGVTAVTWTFDPLVSRNAYFNIAKLGARPVEYLPDFYGGMTDGINAGDASDRLLVRWDLTAPHVVAACAGRRADPDLTGAAVALDRSAAAEPVAGHVSAADLVAGRGAGAGPVAGRVSAADPVAGRGAGAGPVAGGAAGDPGLLAVPQDGTVLVAVPMDVESLRRTDPDLARRWRTAVRDALRPLLAAGARVTGFDRAGWYVVSREGNPA